MTQKHSTIIKHFYLTQTFIQMHQKLIINNNYYIPEDQTKHNRTNYILIEGLTSQHPTSGCDMTSRLSLGGQITNVAPAPHFFAFATHLRNSAGVPTDVLRHTLWCFRLSGGGFGLWRGGGDVFRMRPVDVERGR